MDGIHDMGGMHGFGAVEVEADEPLFHEPWERRVFGLARGTRRSGVWRGGQFRHSIERMDAAHYLASSYYEHWLTGVASRMVEAGVVSRQELDARLGARFTLSVPVAEVVVGDPGPDRLDPRFARGDRVRVRPQHSAGHTRCPRYVRGRTGTVVRLDPAASLPDIEAHSTTTRREPVYSVRFEALELWGAPGDPVHVDLWESYLEAGGGD